MNYALAFSLTLGFLCWLLRKPKPYTTSEWVAAMKKKGIGCK